jgi:hypothetical protein
MKGGGGVRGYEGARQRATVNSPACVALAVLVRGNMSLHFLQCSNKCRVTRNKNKSLYLCQIVTNKIAYVIKNVILFIKGNERYHQSVNILMYTHACT